MNRPIVRFNTPVLRQRGAPVEKITADIRTLAADMIDTMHEARGIGLAAQQVGVAQRLFVIEIPEDMDKDDAGNRLNPELEKPLVAVNPEVVSVLGERNWDYEEGCLSFPEITGRIRRPWAIQARYTGLDGRVREVALHGLAARAFQHELDHLNGVLFIDRMSSVRRVALSGKLKRLGRQTETAAG